MAARKSHSGQKMTRKQRQEQYAERVRHCMRLMRRMIWESGETARQLAAEWEIGVSVVDRMASEASRRIREAQFDRETARALLADQLRVIQKLAMGRPAKNGGVAGRELRTAVAAGEALGRILGLNEQTIRVEQSERVELMEVIRGAVDDATFDRIVSALGGGGEEGEGENEESRLH